MVHHGPMEVVVNEPMATDGNPLNDSSPWNGAHADSPCGLPCGQMCPGLGQSGVVLRYLKCMRCFRSHALMRNNALKNKQ